MEGISIQRELTEQLRLKNIELEAAILAKDRFLASVSHELRTPLNVIIGFTSTLLMRLPGPLTLEQEKQLKSIEVSAKILISLINDILDLAKIESGRVTIELEETNSHEVVTEVMSTLAPLAKSKMIELKCALSDIESHILTDRRFLTQILINFLSNAIKYTEKGYVEVNTHLFKKDNQTFHKIDIIDTGIGIKKEHQSRLFKEFGRLESDGKFQDGTGLGLYVSKKLAGLIGAEIEFQSEHKKGSRFSILIPKRLAGNQQ